MIAQERTFETRLAYFHGCTSTALNRAFSCLFINRTNFFDPAEEYPFFVFSFILYLEENPESRSF